ncbi:MAG: fused MFS/spermidine synthase [Patescibacteria group bacterium]
MKTGKYILEIAIFICGAIVMVFELVGSRILGPHLGTSIFVWTSLIGIILGSLSLGYYLGGKFADKKTDTNTLSFIIFLSAIFIALTMVGKNYLLIFLQTYFSNIKITSIVASLILFSPASLLLGMVSPYAAKLKLSDLQTSGSTIGNLYAISTAGSIFGTFLSGFYLIPNFGTDKMLIIISITLVLISVLLSAKKHPSLKISVFLILIISWFAIEKISQRMEKNGFIDVDTAYNRIWIFDLVDEKNQQPIRTFSINNENSSAMFLNKDDLVYEYTKYYHLASHFHPNFNSALMLGGAGYSFPKDYLLHYPDAKIDVVEIDPKITQLAQKYFKLKENPRLTIFHEDGRVYLNQTNKKYDIIFGDAFSSHYSLPYQLTTQEAIQRKYDILNENGVVILNIISAVNGDRGQFLRAEYLTYKNIFPQVYLFPVKEPTNGEKVQNIILVALKSNDKPDFSSSNSEIDQLLKHLWQNPIASDMSILTDDYAPVDHYISKTI